MKEDGSRWLHFKPLQCPAQSDQNPVLEDPNTQIRSLTKQLTKVGGSGNYGRISPHGIGWPAYQCSPFEQSGTQEKEALSHKENKRESKSTANKDKGKSFHSALYCDVNLLEVRSNRTANPN